MSLALTLKSQERIILGGAVIRNAGPHSVRLVVETPTPILRQRDILSEQKAQTPCGHLYLAVQLLYLEPSKIEELQQLYLKLAGEVLSAAPSLAPILEEVSVHVAGGAYYRALQSAKRLMKQEETLFEYAVASEV